jgi:hypothetical protein
MRKVLACLIAIIFLVSAAQATQYQQKVGPWIVEFESPNNFSSSMAEGTGHWVIAFEDKSKNSSVVFTLFSFEKPKAFDMYMRILFGLYAKSNQLESQTNDSIVIDGTLGIQAYGHSKKYNAIWHGAAWPYKPYINSTTKANSTDDLIILESTNLDQAQFQGITDSLHISKGYFFVVGPWKVEFNLSQKVFPKIKGNEAIKLFDANDHLIAMVQLLSYGSPAKTDKVFLDTVLDTQVQAFSVTSPVKKSVVMDETNGRMAEGYSSSESHKWQCVIYPVGAKYDSFIGANSTKHFVIFNSFQEPDQFQEIMGSAHVTNSEAQ